MRIQIDQSNAADYFGRQLRVLSASGGSRIVLAEGEFIAFASAPTVILQHDNGERSSWQITLPMVEVPRRPLDLAKAAYRAYGETTDFKNFRGEPMPEWGDLGEPIQAAWIAAVTAVRDTVESDTRPNAVREQHMAPDHNLFHCQHPDCRRSAWSAGAPVDPPAELLDRDTAPSLSPGGEPDA